MEYLTVAQAAKRMNIDYSTLLKWIREGKGPNYFRPSPYAIGFRARDVNEWLNHFSTCEKNDLTSVIEGNYINVYRGSNKEHVGMVLVKEVDSIIEAIKRATR